MLECNHHGKIQHRQELLSDVAETILNLPRHHTVRVGIDGVDGAGKTIFADELARALEPSGRTIIRASVDGFHYPKATRYRLGRDSPQGFFLDSYNYPELKAALLEPLSPGGTGRYRRAAFDHRTDLPMSVPEEEVIPGSILIFDGIFLHRPELRTYWDFSIFLEVSFDVSIPRGAQRGEGSPDPRTAENYRYVAGQKIYLQECKPSSRAMLVINNEDLAAPYIIHANDQKGRKIMSTGPITQFIKHHYRHFNAATLVDAAEAYSRHLEHDGYMMITLAGAMSTAELGLSLAEMIRQDKVQIITCTGANLEEDIFNLIAHDFYERVPHWRDLTPAQEQDLLDRHMNRVTDTCIPEMEAMRRLEKVLLAQWQKADGAQESYFPHEFLYKLIRSGVLEQYYQIDPKDSWLIAAAEKDLPIIVPGWEDSTTGNMFAGHCISGDIHNVHTVKTGIQYMMMLADWYTTTAERHSVGFFQLGGGIAGDFPICVVPMLHQDLQRDNVPMWGYFCQVSDSTTSYGSYSGAVPNEKITWGKLSVDTPKYIIESDATIVAPLMFAMILGQ